MGGDKSSVNHRVLLVGWFDKTVSGVVYFPVIEQKSLNLEVLYCPNPQSNLVMRLSSGQLFRSDFTEHITDDELAKNLLGYILAQSRTKCPQLPVGPVAGLLMCKQSLPSLPWCTTCSATCP